MVREFRRWAGYSPSSLPPAPLTTAPIDGAAMATAGDSPAGVTLNAGVRPSSRAVARPVSSGAGRGRGRTTEEAAVQLGGGERGGGGGEGGSCFVRARSLSSRSTFARTASGSEGGRVYKRSRSSGAEGRTAARSGKTGAERAPWGAGPRVSGARARAQAWARDQLSGGGDGGGGRCRTSGSGTGRRSAVRNSECGSGAGAGAGVLAPRGRVRGRRGRAAGGGGSGGAHKHGKRRSRTPKSGRNRDNAGGGRKTRRRRRGGSDVDAGGGVAVHSGQSRRRRASSALDVTRDVLESGEEYPVFASRREGRGSGAVAAEGGGSRGGLEGGRTDRVVTMLAALEEVVMGVCKEMWRLEDKIEDTEVIEATGVPHATLEMENQGESSEDDRDEVAAQVEVCLRDLWSDNPGRVGTVDGATGRSGGGGGGGGGINNANNPVSSSRFEHERVEVEGVAAVVMAREELLEGETDGEEGGGTQYLDEYSYSELELELEHGGAHTGEEQQEAEEGEEDEETLVFGLYQEEDLCSGGGGGPEAERPIPSGIGGEGWRGPVYEEYGMGEDGALFDVVLPPSALPDDDLFGEEEEPAAGHPLELEAE